MTRRLTALALVVSAAMGAVASAPPTARAPALRVCADPDNLPFTDARGGGLENRLAALIAADLRLRVEYVWWKQRRGFLRQTLLAGRCDVVLGLPVAVDAAWTTRPYYTSSYVFVQRRDRGTAVHSLDDRRLRGMRIAVPLVSDDGANAPPAHALASRGLAANLMRFSGTGEAATPRPGASLVDAVATGAADIGVAWGPVAGYFSARQAAPLRLTPIEPSADASRIPLVYAIGMATRRGDVARHAALDAFLLRRRGQIERVLAAFHVPRVEGPGPGARP